MTSISELRTALRELPEALLEPDDQRVLGDALTSLDALERIDVVPSVVAVVGPSGSGKSTLVNAMVGVGSQVAPVGVVRPTTVRNLMIGGSGPVSLATESEYLHVPGARPGMLVIDTPPWEHDPDAVRAAVTVADLVVAVVTQSRYADATVAGLLDAIPDGRPAAVVLNRVAAQPVDLEALLASVRETYGADVVVVGEGDDVAVATEALIADLAIDAVGYERSAVLRSAAASAARHVAGRALASAPALGHLSSVVDAWHPGPFDVGEGTVLDTWEPTRTLLVDAVGVHVTRLDEDLRSASDLGERIGSGLERWTGGPLAEDLDAWRSATVDMFVDRAKVRWRRKAAVDMIDRYAWRTVINADAPLPTRMRRVMGDRLPAAVDEGRRSLAAVLDQACATRAGEWRSVIDRIAGYAPGALAVAADGFASGSARG